MKFLITTIFFLTISLSSFSQVRLGLSAKDIDTEFSDSKYKKVSGSRDDGNYSIQVDLTFARVIYMFDEKKLCTSTLIIPFDSVALHSIIEIYNKNFVIISDTKWKMYKGGSIYNISLEQHDLAGAYFLWY